MAENNIMRGQPVLAQHRVPRDDWDRAPWNRWSFQHIREILPTVEVWRGNGPVWELPRAEIDLGPIGFELANGRQCSVSDWLADDFTDGFIVLHRGQIVFERYLNDLNARSLHLSQSVAKTVVASVAGVLISRGVLDVTKPVTHYLPELENTGWKGALLQHVLDMTTGVKFDEEYTSPDSDIAKVDYCCGWKSKPEGQILPECIWDLILTFDEQVRPHGETFQYRSIETDVLAHIMERVSGMRLAELMSAELWSKLGVEESACFTVDPAGYALADGGFNASLRDYARFGQMICEGGIANGTRILPEQWINATRGRNHEKFGAPYSDSLPDGGYSNQFWLEDPARRTMMARGVFGQLIYMSPDDEMVAVKLSSWPEFLSTERGKNGYAALRAIAKHLNDSY